MSRSRRNSPSAAPPPRVETAPVATLSKRERWRIPFISLPITFAMAFVLAYLLFNHTTTIGKRPSGTRSVMRTDVSQVSQLRAGGYKFVKPLLMVELANESEGLLPLKENLATIIADKKNTGELISASVYVRKLNNGEWTGLDIDEPFLLASMFKVPHLMNWLRLSQEQPGLLQQKILNDLDANAVPRQDGAAAMIQRGQSYTVQQLLESMIVHSDNAATALLKKALTPEQYNRVYADLGMSQHALNYLTYGMSSREYAKFFRALYNGSYLNEANSEYALSLLAQSTYRDGIMRGIPDGTQVPRKFGEKGVNNTKTLSEAGIVYHGNSPYLITVLTKGRDYQELQAVIGELSTVVYRGMSGQPL